MIGREQTLANQMSRKTYSQPSDWLLVISTNQNRGTDTTAQKLSVDWLTTYLFQCFDEQEGRAQGNKITLVKNNQ